VITRLIHQTCSRRSQSAIQEETPLSRLFGLLLLGFALGAFATWAFQSGYRPPLKSNRTNSDHSPLNSHNSPSTKQSVHSLGTLEPQGGSILVTSPLVGTPIKEVLVREGQLVTAGQRLIQLDPTVLEEELRLVQTQRQQAEERQQNEIVLARQRLESASLTLEQAQTARAAEMESQKKQLELAQAKLAQAQDDLKRLQQLDGSGQHALVSAQQIEHQKTVIKLATVEQTAAKTALDRLEQTLQFNQQKAETEKKAADEALSIVARGTAIAAFDRQIKLAEHKVAQAVVTAPSDGTAISVLAHPGELVSTQPLVQLANLTALECHAEVDVADLPLIKGKREALITCRAFRGSKLKATIDRVRSVAGAATLRPVDPRNPIDRTVATVVLKLDGQQAAQLLGSAFPDSASALMGLQVDVEIPL
jgi:ABC exporter DevB family membrane fusion protein